MKDENLRSWHQQIDQWGRAREALLFDGKSLSFGELAEEVGRARATLVAAGVEPGDRVALFAIPSAAGFVMIHALLDLGVVMVPLNLRWTESELDVGTGLAKPRWIVVDDGTGLRGRTLAARCQAGLLRLDADSAGRSMFEIVRAPALPESDAVRVERAAMRAQDAALLLFTSGTSGRPKAALLTAANLRASARASIELLGAEASDRWLCCMPLFHIGGLSILIRSVLAGTSVVLHTGFDAKAVDESLDHDRITRISVVAAMLSQLLDVRADRPPPDSLELVLLGGGPASQELLERARRRGYPIAPTYGLTEAASQVATRPPCVDAGASVDLASGLVPLPGMQIRIVSASGDVVGAGEEGEIEVRGPTVMAGYLDDPAAIANVLLDGWLATGDLGRLDAEGGLRVLDRRSDLILSGGENVYPAEVESALIEHPQIQEAGVVGRNDATYGERPVAFLVTQDGRAIEASALEAFARKRLAGYKVPADWFFVEALPRTASGKLLRRALRDRAHEMSIAQGR